MDNLILDLWFSGLALSMDKFNMEFSFTARWVLRRSPSWQQVCPRTVVPTSRGSNLNVSPDVDVEWVKLRCLNLELSLAHILADTLRELHSTNALVATHQSWKLFCKTMTRRSSSQRNTKRLWINLKILDKHLGPHHIDSGWHEVQTSFFNNNRRHPLPFRCLVRICWHTFSALEGLQCQCGPPRRTGGASLTRSSVP